MKDIPEYEGLYSIDEDGNVFSYKNQKFLKPNMGTNGYLKVDLCKDGNRKTYKIHRLVALTYIPNPDNLPIVDHIDRNKLNNSIENLRWSTYKENNLNKDWEQYNRKLRETYFNLPEEVKKERTRKAVQTHSHPVEMRDKNNHDIIIKTFPSGLQAAIQEFGDAKKQSNISNCAHGKVKSAYGYFWTFADANADTTCENET